MFLIRNGSHTADEVHRHPMRIAKFKEMKSLAFSLLGMGIFRGKRPLNCIFRAALEGVCNIAYEGLEKVHLVAFSSEEAEELQSVAFAYFGKFDEGLTDSKMAGTPPIHRLAVKIAHRR